MANPLTEPLEPYEPTSSLDQYQGYDWDYQEEPSDRRPMNILWGRVGILAGMLLVAFFLGRMTSGGDAGGAELADARDRIEQLTQENETLTTEVAAIQQQLNDAQTQIAELQTAEQPAEDPAAAGEEEPATLTGETYVVKSGDTLQSIAEDFYGDASLSDFLAEVNDISDPAALSVGMELLIPDETP